MTGIVAPDTERPAGPVLVVDDEFDIREAVREVLEGEGYSVVTAVNGSDALTRLNADPRPCLVLLDLMMPVMNGWQVLEEVHRHPRLQTIPIILVTASDSRPEGVAALIRKPFDLDRLLGAVEQFCQS